jgi:hypothetical protein
LSPAADELNDLYDGLESAWRAWRQRLGRQTATSR